MKLRNQEKELRTSELNMLINQISLFSYNTLDTIYMLARINGEKTTMKMIQSLSTYLRLSLSKGKDIVTVGDELENVQSYMEILQIRNSGLFLRNRLSSGKKRKMDSKTHFTAVSRECNKIWIYHIWRKGASFGIVRSCQGN